MKANKLNSQTGVLWHPNFRVEATLPDTKVIRTSFLVNSVVAALLLATGAAVVHREQELSDIREQTAEWDARIAENNPKFAAAAKIQKQFSDLEVRLKEIDGFVTSDYLASRVLRMLAETLPRYFTIDAIEMVEQGVRLKGTIVGPPGKATDIATAYVGQLNSQLKTDSLFTGKTWSAALNTITRDPGPARMVFEIDIKAQQDPKPRK